jgi:hypothetical protein
MDWFKNLNAAPRLLLSFGLLIMLIAAISCLAIINLTQANDGITAVYQKDMAGLGVADELVIARLSLGRVGRDAILNMSDATVATADDKEILSALSDLHASLDQADKLFDLKEGIALIATMREALPGYEKSYLSLIVGEIAVASVLNREPISIDRDIRWKLAKRIVASACDSMRAHNQGALLRVPARRLLDGKKES